MYIGTTNFGKVREIFSLLSPLGIKLETVSLDKLEETGNSLIENAIIKAMAYASISGGITLSEDSGLFIPALGNLPGIWSARFYDLDVTNNIIIDSNKSHQEMDDLNNNKVLSMMSEFDMPRRAASFKVAMVVAHNGKILFQSESEYAGWISNECRGDKGFGYDSIFIGQDTFGKTLAEIDGVRKNLRSHRKRVLDDLFVWASSNIGVLR